MAVVQLIYNLSYLQSAGRSIQTSQQKSTIQCKCQPSGIQWGQPIGYGQHIWTGHCRQSAIIGHSRWATIILFRLLIFNEFVYMLFLSVIQLSDIVDRKGAECIPRRTIPVPAAPYLLALSCDHSMLAVCYASNNSSFITIYSVQSFLSNVRVSNDLTLLLFNVRITLHVLHSLFQNVTTILQNIRISTEHNVKATQILWNPVVGNTMAVCLDSGSISVYVLKDNSFELFSIDKAENAR